LADELNGMYGVLLKKNVQIPQQSFMEMKRDSQTHFKL
jgi:hypothetical protein